MIKSLGVSVCHVFIFLFFVQSTTPLRLETDLRPLVRQTRQASNGCVLPPYPANGRYVTQGASLTPGSTVAYYTLITFQCDRGFIPVNNISICLEKTSTWSKTGTCEGISSGCTVPNPPANGIHYLENNERLAPGIKVHPFTMLHFACDSGYNLTSKMSICQGTEWSAKPKCERIGGCVLPKMPDNGEYVVQSSNGAINPGSSVNDFTILEYTCNKGYVAAKTISLCNGGKWAPIPVCKKLCEKLTSSTVNLDCSPAVKEGCPIGSVITPSCKAGYRPDGPIETMKCLGGTWDIRQPKCKLITCSLQQSNTVYFACSDSENEDIPCPTKIADGKRIYFSCKEGHARVNGGNFGVLTCSGGRWDKAMPKCTLIPTTTTEQPVIDGIKCALPRYPDNGKFLVSGPNKNLRPGVVVEEYTVITYTCDTNYDPSTAQVYSTCEAGKWDIKSPICRKRCKMIGSLSVDFKCWNSGMEVTCSKLLPYGTLITSSCKSGHHNPTDDLDDLRCSQGGNWDYPIPSCKPDCGLEKGQGGVQIVYGTTAKKDTFPWHVGIFQWDESKNTIEQICGGSLIHANLVISAAHCFFDPILQVKIDAKYYKVAAGKFLRSWDNDLVENTKIIQKSDVYAIHFPLTYGGDEQNQQHDLALLQLTSPFSLSQSVRAVCYDLLDETFDTYQLVPGNVGKVAGWGRTETGEPSEELKTLELPVIGYGECRIELSKYKFSKYLTTDKLCAGHLNGRAMCQGDSGGGLVFPSTDKSGFIRWYLRGVVSNGPLNDAKTTCRANTYTAFTNIYKMRDWLKRTIRTVTRPIDNDD